MLGYGFSPFNLMTQRFPKGMYIEGPDLRDESSGLRIGFVVGVVAVEGRLLIFPNLEFHF